ncbi:Regulator of G-protein signaling protein-like, partial [Opisthocomus hoazin]
QVITINFLMDDLRFYLEIDKARPHMPLQVFQAVEALAAQNIQSEKEVAFLKSKAVIISKLFLNSDVPPKSRIRCWD